MAQTTHPMPRSIAPRPIAYRAQLRRLAIAVGAVLLFGTIVGALHAIVGDLAIATMIAGLAAITAAPLFGGRA